MSLRKIRTLDMLSAFLLFYLPLSVVLSISVALRHQQVFSGAARIINILTYFGTYDLIPLVVLGALLIKSIASSGKFREKLKATTPCLLAVFFVVLYCLCNLTQGYVTLDYVIYPSLLVLAIFYYKPRSKFHSRWILAFTLAVVVLTPHLTTFVCYESALRKATSVGSSTASVRFVSGYVMNTTTSTYLLRAESDLWKFLLVGAGQCGEMAVAVTSFLKTVNVPARRILLLGESHEFVEAYLNGSWWVVDPGYYSSEITTRKERAERRIREYGSISSVFAYNGSTFTDLTPEYVPVDTIVIRTTYDGEPLRNVQVVLVHTFKGSDRRLPAFCTNANGTIVVRLGAMTYNEKANPCEPYYRILINERSTQYNVTSTGSNKTYFVNLPLTWRP